MSPMWAHTLQQVTYHASCHTLRELGVNRQPHALLEHVAGAEQVALTRADKCCGFGGLFAVKNAAISSTMGRRKTQNLAATEADIAVLCDVDCMTHINGLLSAKANAAAPCILRSFSPTRWRWRRSPLPRPRRR